MCQKRYYLLQGTTNFLDVIDGALDGHLCECDRLASAVAINEVLINAFVHGSGSDSSIPILMTVCTTDCYLMVAVSDCGDGIGGEPPDLRTVPDPWEESGRGLFLIHHYADDVQFHGSTVMIRKRLCAGTPRRWCPKRMVEIDEECD